MNTAAALTSASLTVDTSTNSAIAGLVQESNVMRVTFASPVPLNAGCNIVLAFPSQLKVGTVTTIQAFGMFGSLATVTATTVSASSNTITIQECTSYTSNNLNAIILLTSLKLPNDVKTTSSLKISVTSSSGADIA